jgi:glycosyltransferase involved in cell wall biosynthesis
MRGVFQETPGVTAIERLEVHTALFQPADIAIFLDSRRGGMKNRVLQAMAAGRPVIATEQALEGIFGRTAEHYVSLREPQEALHHLLTLGRDEELRLRMGAAARKEVRLRYSQEVTGRAWESLYEEVRSMKVPS